MSTMWKSLYPFVFLSATVFGSGVAWGIVKLTQRNLTRDVDEMREEMGKLKHVDDCRSDRSDCSTTICQKIDDLKAHISAIETKRERDKETMVAALSSINTTLGRIDERLKAGDRRMEKIEERWEGTIGG